MPPSAAHTAPVTYGVWSEARKAMTAATSSGSPARPSGMPAEQRLGVRGRDPVRHRRVGVAGDDAVHPDALGRVVGRHDAHEAVDARLARAVGVVARRHAVLAGGRARADDGAAAGREQRPQAVLAGEKDAGEVDGDGSVPHLEREPVGAVVLARELDARVGDDDVEPAPCRDGALDGARHLILVGDVGDEHQPLASARLDLGGGVGDRGLVAVDQADPGALGDEPDRGRAPHAHPGAGDDRALPVEQAHGR